MKKVLVPLLMLSVFAETTFTREALIDVTDDDFGHSLQEHEIGAVIVVLQKAGYLNSIEDDRFKFIDIACKQTIRQIYDTNEERWTSVNYND